MYNFIHECIFCLWYLQESCVAFPGMKMKFQRVNLELMKRSWIAWTSIFQVNISRILSSLLYMELCLLIYSYIFCVYLHIFWSFCSIEKSWEIGNISSTLLSRRWMGLGHHLLLLYGQYLYHGSSNELWTYFTRNSQTLSK